MVRPPERASRAGGRRVAGACPSVPSRSVAGPRPAPTHAARRQFPKEHACRASPTAESPLSAGRMYRNQPVMRLDRCAYTNGSPSSTQRLPPLAHMRGSACARTPSCRRLTICPPCCLRRCVLNELRASLHAGPRSWLWRPRSARLRAPASPPTCLHAVAPGAVLRSWLSVPLCVRLQMLS